MYAAPFLQILTAFPVWELHRVDEGDEFTVRSEAESDDSNCRCVTNALHCLASALWILLTLLCERSVYFLVLL